MTNKCSDSKEMVEVVASPCVGICSLDVDDICIGCQRTGKEISRWGEFSGKERKDVMKLVSQREKEKFGW